MKDQKPIRWSNRTVSPSKSQNIMNNISWHDNGLCVTLHKKCDLETVLEIKEKLYGDAYYESIQFQVWDLSQVEEFELSETDMKIIGALDRSSSRWNDKMKVFILHDDEVAARLFNIYTRMMITTNWVVHLLAKGQSNSECAYDVPIPVKHLIWPHS